MPSYFKPTAPAAPATSSYWRPNALSNPNIPYPASPYAGPPGGGTVPRGGNGMGNWLAMRNNLAARNLAAQTPNPSAAFGVNVGDFGGSGIAGGTVKKGDFGGAFAPNTTFNGGGISGAGGGGGMAGGVGGGAGGGGAGNNLLSQYQSAMNRANQANEARYQDVLGGYQQRYQRGMDMLSGLGQQQSKDINELYDQQQGNINNNLINSGLMNSSVASTMAMGNNRERNADLGRLNDSVRQQAMAADAGLSGDTLQFMERKTEAQPNVGLLAQIMQSLGQGGYGGGGMGAIGGGGGGIDPSLMGLLGGMGGGYGGYMGPSSSYGGLSPQAAAMYAARNAGKKGDSDYNALMASMTNMPAPAAGVIPWSGRNPADVYADSAFPPDWRTPSQDLYAGLNPSDAAFLDSQGNY